MNNHEPVVLVLALVSVAAGYVGAAMASKRVLWGAMAIASAAFLLLILGKVI